MINWIIITILIVSALIALKMNRIRHKIWIITLILAALFLYTSVTVVYSEHQVKLDSAEGVFQASKIYLGWLANGFQNIKSLTGNAVKMDWTKTNASFFNKTKEIEPEKV